MMTVTEAAADWERRHPSTPMVREWGVPFETRGSTIVQWFSDRARAIEFAGQKRVSVDSMFTRDVPA